MSGLLYNDPGYLGCNFCGHITCFDKRKLRIAWVLCKRCYFVYCKQATPVPHPQLPGHRYAKKITDQDVDLSGPIGYSLPTDHFYWNVDDHWHVWGHYEVPEPIDPNAYHLLTYKPKENRQYDALYSVNDPEAYIFVERERRVSSNASSSRGERRVSSNASSSSD